MRKYANLPMGECSDDADHARVCPPRNPRLLFISASYFTSFNSSINRGHFPHLSIIYST